MKYISLSEIATYKQGKQIPIEKQFLECKNGMKRFVRIIDFTNPNELPRYIEDLGEQYEVDEKCIIMIRYGSQTAGTVVRGISGIIANNMFQVCINDRQFDMNYIYYYLTSPQVKNMLMGGQSSSTMPAITFGMMDQIKIPVRELDEQKKIASILEVIEIKSKVNESINRNLEEQQHLLYSYYFENNLYKTCKVKDAVCFSQGVQVPVEEQLTECKNGYTQFIRIVDVAQDNSDVRYIKHVDRANIKEKDIFMVRYGSQTAGMVARGKNGIIANNLFTISSEILSNEYLYCYFGSKSVKDYLKGNSTSSTMPAINFATLNGMNIAIPNQDILTEFSSIAQSLFDQQLLIRKQNENLQVTRNGLLPRLMSGELDVSNLDI